MLLSPRRYTIGLACLFSSLLAACGTDTATDGGHGSTGGSSTADGGEAPTSGAGETGTSSTSSGGEGTVATSSTSGGTSSSSGGEGTSSTSSGGAETSSSGGEESTSSTDGAGESGDTTGEEPPIDVCAHQDDPPPNVGMRKAINDDPAFIQVYVNNIENLKLAGEECAGDWTDLIWYMKTIKPSPDLFLVQQISDQQQLDHLVQRMTDDLPGIFEGVIADEKPWTQGSPCGPEKARQTNAIIFRKGRFDVVGAKYVWQSWAHKNGKCVRNSQARTRNVMIKLHDKIADKDVTVASLHWSTFQGDGPDPACAEANIAEADQKLHKKGFKADLVVFGGDFNESDRTAGGNFRGWYKAANGDDGGELNYRDPIFRMCQGGGLKACLDDNWTIGSGRRIDAMFAQDGHGCRARTDRAHTITYNEAEAAAEELTGDVDPKLHYSEHRAIRAEIYY